MNSALPCCCVIRIPFDFRDGNGAVQKRFVVVGHEQGAAIAIKAASSRLERYGVRPEQYAGIVFLPASSIEPFRRDTVIDPSNMFAIPHGDLETHHRRNQLTVWPPIEGLKESLCTAVSQNHTLEQARIEGLRRCLGCA